MYCSTFFLKFSKIVWKCQITLSARTFSTYFSQTWALDHTKIPYPASGCEILTQIWRQDHELCSISWVRAPKLVARGKPSTMVTAREACRDEKSKMLHCTPPCVMPANASEFVPLHDFHSWRSIARTMLEFNHMCTTQIMRSNSKMLDVPCIFQHVSKIFKMFMEMSKHIIGCNFFHRIFPDMSFGPHQDTICGFRIRDPHSNLTTGSRDMLDFMVPTVHILA